MVAKAREDGYQLATALSAMDLPSSTWYYHRNEKVDYEQKYSHLKPLLEEIIDEHPGYGYRRIKVELEREHGLKVNHKVILRLLRLWNLNINREVKKKVESPVRKTIRNSNGKMDLLNNKEKIAPLEAMVTDFTELRYKNGDKKAHLMAIIGYRSKMIYGWGVSKRADTDLALKAWRRAKKCFKEQGISWDNMIMHHDRDSVYTSYRWLDKLLNEDNVRVSYSQRGAKDNTEMESFNSHFKGESKSLFLDSSSVEALAKIVEGRVQYYNRDRLHSTLDYTPPFSYVKGILNNREKK